MSDLVKSIGSIGSLIGAAGGIPAMLKELVDIEEQIVKKGTNLIEPLVSITEKRFNKRKHGEMESTDEKNGMDTLTLQNTTDKSRRISTGNTMDKNQEIPVKPFGRVSKIVPDYFSINLPYYTKVTLNTGNTGPSNEIDLRLNSIYDPIVGATANNQPQGRDQWALTFQYYRVVGSQVKLTLLTNETSGLTERPSTDTWVFAYELDEQLGNVSNSFDALMMTKHAERTLISTAPQTSAYNGTGITHNPNHPNMSILQHTYSPGKWDHHVQEVGSQERWTPVGENPAYFHNMAIRLIGMDGQSITADRWELLVQVNYTVQFREANHTLIKQLEGNSGPNDPPTS